MAGSNTPQNPISIQMIGFIVGGVAALGLAIVLLIVFVRRRKQRVPEDEEKASAMAQVQPRIARMPNESPAAGLVRAVSRRNLTPSVVLPMPVPPVPAARPRPPKVSPIPAVHPSGRPLSSVEIIVHHETAGTMPRPFGRHNFVRHDPSQDARTSTPSITFSRSSILSAALPSSLRSSSASSAVVGQELLKVRQVFAPLLPDELVLRVNEKVTVIQTFEDGWCVVGRKSPFHAPSPANSDGYAFGRGETADEIEIGLVPTWVFERRTNGSPKPERPIRSSSLGITLLLDESQGGPGGAREELISWSNF